MKVIRFDDKEFEILKSAIAAAQARYMLLQNDDPDNKQYMLRLRAFNNLWDKVLIAGMPKASYHFLLNMI